MTMMVLDVYSTVTKLLPSRMVHDNDIEIIADGYTVNI
jgi:hypothetical protein